MKKIDTLIKKFKEIKDELVKDGVNSTSMGSAATAGGTATINSQIGNPFGKKEDMKFQKNGQWSLGKVDPEENVNIPHSSKKAKMASPKVCSKCKANPCTCAN